MRMAASVTEGFYIPDGNEALRDDIPVVVELTERTARWVNPETFRRACSTDGGSTRTA
jgi:hypothetical protein